MIQIDKTLLEDLFAKAKESDRKRMKAAIKREESIKLALMLSRA